MKHLIAIGMLMLGTMAAQAQEMPQLSAEQMQQMQQMMKQMMQAPQMQQMMKQSIPGFDSQVAKNGLEMMEKSIEYQKCVDRKLGDGTMQRYYNEFMTPAFQEYSNKTFAKAKQYCQSGNVKGANNYVEKSFKHYFENKFSRKEMLITEQCGEETMSKDLFAEHGDVCEDISPAQ